MTNVTYFFLTLLFKCLALLPIRCLRWLGKTLGHILWLTNNRSKQATLVNLAACFPEKSIEERTWLAKSSLQNLVITALELGPIWFSPLDKLLANVVSVEGEEYLERALADGNGAILLAPHMGAWELLGMYLSGKYMITSLYQPPDNAAMDRLIFKARSRNGSQLAATQQKGVKTLLKALKRKELIAILPDQVPPKEGGAFADFFGVPALTTTLVKNLSSRTGAKIVLAAAYRIESTGHYKIIFQAVDETIYSADTQESLTALNQSVERCVLIAPEQYQWEYKRFKKQPPGRPKYY